MLAVSCKDAGSLVFIFTKDNVEEIINIQPKGSKAKGYQIKQVRNLIVKYGLGDSDVG